MPSKIEHKKLRQKIVRNLFCLLILLGAFSAKAGSCVGLEQESSIDTLSLIETKLSGLPILREKMKNWVVSGKMDPLFRDLMRRNLSSSKLDIVPLNSKVREALQLPQAFNGALYVPRVNLLSVRKMLIGESELLNSLIPNDVSGTLNREKFSLVVRDTNYDFSETLFDVQVFVHELAHFDMHQIFEKNGDKIVKILPPHLFRKTEFGYEIHPELSDLIQEWYAYRLGFMSIPSYQRYTFGVSTSYHIFFNTPAGRYDIYIRDSNADELAREVTLRTYGIRNPEVIAYAQSNILDQILELSTCIDN